MRPRVFPAEDRGEVRLRAHGCADASMRPRVFPAEDRMLNVIVAQGVAASMRPRVFPAEDR